jgi:hypothetical protein
MKTTVEFTLEDLENIIQKNVERDIEGQVVVGFEWGRDVNGATLIVHLADPKTSELETPTMFGVSVRPRR